MSRHVIETVLFRLKDGISRDDFVKAAETVNGFVAARKGFVSRRLSCTADGLWIEHIEWADMTAAKAAAADLGKTAPNLPFLSAIDEPSVTLHHGNLDVTLN